MAETLIGELREKEHPVPKAGTPHPDPILASKGWQACCDGVYVRRQATAEAEAEAG
jgi:hypothetical protein